MTFNYTNIKYFIKRNMKWFDILVFSFLSGKFLSFTKVQKEERKKKKKTRSQVGQSQRFSFLF